jgi:pyrroline-5-carboxylate reductase
MNVLDSDQALVSLLTRTLAAAERRNVEMAAAAKNLN